MDGRRSGKGEEEVKKRGRKQRGREGGGKEGSEREVTKEAQV